MMMMMMMIMMLLLMIMTYGVNFLYIVSRFVDNQPNEICSHLSEKASKGRFLNHEKFQNHTNEGKGKKKKPERGEGKEEKKKKTMVALLVFIIETFSITFFIENCKPQNVT